MVANSTNLIVDSNIFIGFNWDKDPNHQKCFQSFVQIAQNNQQVTINNYIAAEIATVLLIRTRNLQLSASITESLYINHRTLKLEQLSRSDQREVLDIFKSQDSFKLSFTDCTLLWQAKKYKCEILTLDEDLQKAAKKFLI